MCLYNFKYVFVYVITYKIGVGLNLWFQFYSTDHLLKRERSWFAEDGIGWFTWSH